MDIEIDAEDEVTEFALTLLTHLNLRCMSSARMAARGVGETSFYKGELTGQVDALAWLLSLHLDAGQPFDGAVFQARKLRLMKLFLIEALDDDYSPGRIGTLNEAVLNAWKGE